ncbi:DUF4156 domain-containing protein [Parahaliea mediterranea]|uniref:DUF4156 domain-containing protein n=1 Tax=Parahaliea mediterranea TaxID=651086 RepID=UPI0013008AE0|nr:DUF4156 domain-containing protein [Parahaliea mediterranea]
MRFILAAALLLPLAACTWVDLSKEGKTVTVVSKVPTSCKRLGSTTSATRSSVASIDRNSEKVAAELSTLARNAAARMGADTISAESGINAKGEQVFGVYRCGL